MVGLIKWICAAVGYTLTDDYQAAVVGFLIGSAVEFLIRKVQGVLSAPERERILKNIATLAAAIMRADSDITRDELEYAQAFFHENFGEEGGEEILEIVSDLLDKEIDVENACLYLRHDVSVEMRVQLLYFFYGLAGLNGNARTGQMGLLYRIASLLGLEDTTYRSIKSMFHEEVDSAYTILGIPSTATNEEVKKAYRKAAVKHHPDKVGYMGENIRKAAEEKFSTINAAYEKIKLERGL